MLKILHFSLPDILNIPPGCKEGVLFCEDGMTVIDQEIEEEKDLNPESNVDIQIKINLEEVVDTNAHLAGRYFKYTLYF